MFFVLNGIGLLIYYACIGLTDLAGLGSSKLWYNAALVVGTGLGTLFRFWSYRKWVWLAPSATPVLSPAESDQERAQDLAAMVGAAPVSHLANGQDPTAIPTGQRSGPAAPAHARRSTAGPELHLISRLQPPALRPLSPATGICR